MITSSAPPAAAPAMIGSDDDELDADDSSEHEHSLSSPLPLFTLAEGQSGLDFLMLADLKNGSDLRRLSRALVSMFSTRQYSPEISPFKTCHSTITLPSLNVSSVISVYATAFTLFLSIPRVMAFARAFLRWSCAVRLPDSLAALNESAVSRVKVAVIRLLPKIVVDVEVDVDRRGLCCRRSRCFR